jgi:hypothetical protein
MADRFVDNGQIATNVRNEDLIHFASVRSELILGSSEKCVL